MKIFVGCCLERKHGQQSKACHSLDKQVWRFKGYIFGICSDRTQMTVFLVLRGASWFTDEPSGPAVK